MTVLVEVDAQRSRRTRITSPTRLGILLNAEAGAGQAFHVCNLGLTPYKARLDQNFFDIWGLADSFMARLPAMSWRPGHLMRVRPLGLAESLATGSPVFVDPGLNRYFEILRNVTGSERLLGADRVKHLVGMNLGLYDQLLPETIEFTESAQIVPEAGNAPFLRRVLEGLPVHTNAYRTPHCDLIDHSDSDVLLRERIP